MIKRRTKGLITTTDPTPLLPRTGEGAVSGNCLRVGAKKTRGNSPRAPSAFPLTSGGELPYFNALSYAIETKIKVNPWEPVDNCLENLPLTNKTVWDSL